MARIYTEPTIHTMLSTTLTRSVLLLALLFAESSAAEERGAVDPEVKQLSGISIIGNKEAPKSLYIVPWQDSEVGVATTLSSGLMDDNKGTLDRDVLERELAFYELSKDQ